MIDFGAYKTPSKATLNKYGLTELEWMEMLDEQQGRCFICRKIPSSKRLVIDHEHVKNWRHKPAEERKLYCRGLLCAFCNRFYLAKGINLDKARNVVRYLLAHEARLADALNRL